MARADFDTRDHAAWNKGHAARIAGQSRLAPYGLDTRLARFFRRAWLDGFDTAEAEIAQRTGKPRTCRVCGCTDTHACANRCWWVAEDLCSNCSGPPPRRATAFTVPRRAA
jgi:hypothetical protein